MPRWLLTSVSVASAVLFVGTLAAIPWLLKRLPVDHFVAPSRPIRWQPLRTLGGVTLILLGIAMLVLPGQGLLTIVVGVSMVSHPKKDQLLRWVLKHPSARAALQAGRRAVKAEPFRFD